MTNKQNMREVLLLLIGEAIVSAITVLGAFIISLFSEYVFDFRAILGALLGVSVTVLNFLFLTISVNRAVDSYLEVRGSREMSEEEAEKFTAENSMIIQNKIKTSFIIRTVTMLLALVLAFVTGLFNPLCTVIPMLMFRPLISIGQLFKGNKQNEK